MNRGILTSALMEVELELNYRPHPAHRDLDSDFEIAYAALQTLPQLDPVVSDEFARLLSLI